MEKNLDTTKPRYSECILPVFRPFVISSFYCILLKSFLKEFVARFTTYVITQWILTSDWIILRGSYAMQAVFIHLFKKNWKVEHYKLIQPRENSSLSMQPATTWFVARPHHTSWEQYAIRFTAKEVALLFLLLVLPCL